jgi:hypothetical protein
MEDEIITPADPTTKVEVSDSIGAARISMSEEERRRIVFHLLPIMYGGNTKSEVEVAREKIRKRTLRS